MKKEIPIAEGLGYSERAEVEEYNRKVREHNYRLQVKNWKKNAAKLYKQMYLMEHKLKYGRFPRFRQTAHWKDFLARYIEECQSD